MTSNYWVDTVYAEPPLSGLTRTDMSAAFSWLELHFLLNGTKIDWQRARGKHAHWRVDDGVQLMAMAMSEVLRRISPGSEVEHIGDGLSPFGVSFTDNDSESIVGALLEIPEHHYFVAGDRAWIVVVTTEGDLDVMDQLS